MNGRVLLGISAQVIVDRSCAVIRYKGADGETLVEVFVGGVEYGDHINIPFYGDVSATVDESCEECGA